MRNFGVLVVLLGGCTAEPGSQVLDAGGGLDGSMLSPDVVPEVAVEVGTGAADAEDATQGAQCALPTFPRISTRIETGEGSFGCEEGGLVSLPAPGAGGNDAGLPDAGSQGDVSAPQDAGQPMRLSWTGRIVSTSAGEFAIDECGATAPCAPKLVKFTIRAEGLVLGLRVNAFVAVTADVRNFNGCIHNLVVNNVASHAGVVNPVDPTAALALVVSDGYLQTTQDLFKTTARRQHCAGSSPITDPAYDELGRPGYPGLFALPDNYTLHFAAVSRPQSVVDLRMGETVVWTPSPGTPALKYRLHNVRSFQQAGNDAYWDWAYWVQAVK